MKLKSAQIKNFRTLKDVYVEFDSVTTFIGPNGTGKSTILRALDWFFNGKPGSLSERDCSFGATCEDIEVQATFGDLTTKDRIELGKYAPPDTGTFTAWKRRAVDGSETLSANAKGLPEFNRIKGATNATDKKSWYAELRGSRPDLALPAASTGPAVEAAITTWETEHTDQLQDVPENLQTNFFGFNSGGKMSGLFDYVLVTADLRASEESVDQKTSIVGRILERSVDRSAADGAIALIVEESRSRQQQIYEQTFKDQLDSITSQLNEVVTSYSPGRSISVVPSDVELKAPRTTFNVSVLDGETETAVERQGHGFQRTLLVSALQVLAQSSATSSEGVICLAIEEPELFQHPIQAQAFAKILRSLAEDDSKRLQITYATHSPYFLEARHFEQVRRLTRSSSNPPVVTVHAATVSDVKTRLSSALSAATVDRQLDCAVAGELSIALFAHRALVVEGSTEAAVLYGIGDRQNVASLETAGTSVVCVGGKSSMPLAHAILTALGIPTYALFDGDSGFELRARVAGKTDDKIASERQGHVIANRTLLKYFGLPEVDFPGQLIGDEAAIFEDQLETFLEANWPEWRISCSSVESLAGIVVAKSQYAYRMATLRAGGTVPQMLTDILTKAGGA